MKLYCAWHKKYYPDEIDSNGDFYLGEKEPFDNTRRTDGLCPSTSLGINGMVSLSNHKKCEEKLAEEINVIRGTTAHKLCAGCKRQ